MLFNRPLKRPLRLSLLALFCFVLFAWWENIWPQVKVYFSNEDKEWLNLSKRCREWVSRSTEAQTSKNSSLRMLKGHFCSRFCKMFRLNFWMKTNRKRPPVAGKIIKKKRSSWCEISYLLLVLVRIIRSLMLMFFLRLTNVIDLKFNSKYWQQFQTFK